MKEDAIIVLTTAPDSETGYRLAEGLVAARLAACVNVVPGLRSFYVWKGKLEREEEVQLVIKSRTSRSEQLQAWIADQHPYDVPEFLVIGVASASTDYMRFIAEQTADD
jgi:periplasmic divalent cation tolerance protein